MFIVKKNKEQGYCKGYFSYTSYSLAFVHRNGEVQILSTGLLKVEMIAEMRKNNKRLR